MKIKYIFLIVFGFMLFNSAYSAEKELTFKEFAKWAKKTDYVILPNTFFCPHEKYTRNILNYIVTNGSVSSRIIESSKCTFVNMNNIAKFISVSKDKKIAKVLTHDIIYGGQKKIQLIEGYVYVNYLISKEKLNKAKF